MKIVILVILYVLAFFLLRVTADANPCWPCYDCLYDCERGDGKECCEEASRECCDDCDNFIMYYQMCLDRVDSEESYIEHRMKRKVNEYRQRFLEETEDSMPTQ